MVACRLAGGAAASTTAVCGGPSVPAHATPIPGPPADAGGGVEVLERASIDYSPLV